MPAFTAASETGEIRQQFADKQSLTLDEQVRTVTMKLKNKVAIVTGASSGIGYAAAKAFAAAGAKVVVTARRQTLLDHLVSEIEHAGGRAVSFAGDVKDVQFAEALVEKAVKDFGGLDVAFNNAGIIGAAKNTADMSLEEWKTTIDTNLTSYFLAAKHQIPEMQKKGQGSLIFTSSFLGHTVGVPGYGDYAASKVGILGLVKVLAVELGPDNIRANALLPGGTDTPMNFANAPEAGPEVQEFVNGIHALKRMASPDEVARAALFLASDDSSFVTGTSMLVDGGASITKA